MKEYHKIQTVFKRSPESKYKNLIEGDFTMPEFEALKDIEWTWTEKIDGTNIRILWDGMTIRFGGRTDSAQIPTTLLKVLQDKFSPDIMKQVFGDSAEVCLYGEGYGNKIQTGNVYMTDSVDFILFDVRVGSVWLTRESTEDIAKKVSIKIVPIISKGDLMTAVSMVRAGFISTISQDRRYIAEGLIMKPSIDLLTRTGERIITKIKHKDFSK